MHLRTTSQSRGKGGQWRGRIYTEIDPKIEQITLNCLNETQKNCFCSQSAEIVFETISFLLYCSSLSIVSFQIYFAHKINIVKCNI